MSARTYELIYVLEPDATEQQVADMHAFVEGIVEQAPQHDEIALLEDPQREGRVREEDGSEGEHRGTHGPSQPAPGDDGVATAPILRGLAERTGMPSGSVLGLTERLVDAVHQVRQSV